MLLAVLNTVRFSERARYMDIPVWMMVVLGIVLVGLIGVFIYLRNKPEDDD